MKFLTNQFTQSLLKKKKEEKRRRRRKGKKKWKTQDLEGRKRQRVHPSSPEIHAISWKKPHGKENFSKGKLRVRAL
jgi:hypothetical protein